MCLGSVDVRLYERGSFNKTQEVTFSAEVKNGFGQRRNRNFTRHDRRPRWRIDFIQANPMGSGLPHTDRDTALMKSPQKQDLSISFLVRDHQRPENNPLTNRTFHHLPKESQD
jgi:hypothetical protein